MHLNEEFKIRTNHKDIGKVSETKFLRLDIDYMLNRKT